ncbi:GNAT family N-acetyltransferase [Clostridium botulinum]|uniref:GNAT family N-acetyltransferase n=2 Tax=Clostridium botulinum TaxID=1491 RepID=A0A846I1L5_CLOBO|nr:GNAT family N-acetyltransferase [Clostridium botulinum]ACQ53405.1 acetyltransferase, GNAT family [Clostridium botulinum Ba4 str. 657]AJE09462.1 acetyltransferase domain protein [Clostridium botulinum CDC_1436]AXG92137.1 GNAT family N-acetyltransferase [Clostridium botulinum]EDT85467.1 acetyltransferase, GNAT family [Clostridium botulinum Bf]MBY6757381.1 GNAT family N-acetyltransferase [Clostridium botulinum]
MNFRKANANDVNELVLLFKNLQDMHSENVTNIFNQNISECVLNDYISNVILNEDYNFYIVEDKKKIIGAIEVITIIEKDNPVLKNREYALIDKLVVDNNYRGYGIGNRLIEYVEKDLKSRGIKEIEIYVWEFNRGALNLYEKKGYKTICRRMTKSI